MGRINGPCRDVSPCKGCDRPQKKSGCHDHCQSYQAWRESKDAVNHNRIEYIKAPTAKFANMAKAGRKR